MNELLRNIRWIDCRHVQQNGQPPIPETQKMSPEENKNRG